MHRRVRQRLIQTAILVAVSLAGVWAYQRVVRPDRTLLFRLAESKLQQIFGPSVRYDDFEIDLVDGVTIRGLEVRGPDSVEPTLTADRVRVVHDLVALASGTYRPQSIVIERARLVTHETDAGIALDFPFELERSEGEGHLPEIRVISSRLLYRAMEESERLRDQLVLELVDVDLEVDLTARGTFDIRGGFRTLRLGQDDVRIHLNGFADAQADQLDVVASWDPLRLTPELLASLDPAVAEPLRERGLRTGRLVVSLTRHPAVEAGQLQVKVGWSGEVEVGVTALPDAEIIDATTREQLRALFGRGPLDLEVTRGGIDIKGLASAVGGGQITATGRIDADGESYELAIKVRGLRLDDPAIREALGEAGAEIFDAFDPSGVVDADVRVSKEPDGEPEWVVDALLEDMSLRYVGVAEEDGTRVGFPYRVQQAAGSLRITPGLVTFEEIVGFNGSATVRIRGHEDNAWSGGETGRIRLTEAGPDIRLTVEARDVPVDAALHEAVEGSELAGLLDRFQIGGTIDMIEVDIVRIPDIDDVAVAEVRVTLDDETFRYREFPLPLSDVRGWVTLRRPVLARPDMPRGRTYAFDVHGLSDDTPVHAWAAVDEVAEEGRLHVEAEGISLAGALGEVILTAEETRDGLGQVWRYLDPRGRARVEASFPLAEAADPMVLDVTLRGASVRLDAERAEHALEIDELVGEVHVEGDRVELRELRGRLEDAGVRLGGVVEGGTDGAWDLEVETDRLRLTPRFLAGIQQLVESPTLLPLGLVLLPDGRLALTLDLERPPGPDETLAATIRARDIDALVRMPQGTVLAVVGESLVVDGEVVTLEDVRATAPGLELVVEQAEATPAGLTGRFVLALREYADAAELLRLAPEAIAGVLAPWIEGRRLTSERLVVATGSDGALTFEGDLELLAEPEGPVGDAPRGSVAMRPLVLGPPDDDGVRALDGVVRFDGMTLAPLLPVEDLVGEARVDDLRLGDDPAGRILLDARSARLLDLSVADLHVPITWEDGILRAEGITGIVAGGRLSAWILAHTRAPVAWEGAAQVRAFDVAALRNDLAPTGPAYQGTGDLTVQLQSRGDSLRDLTAQGHLRVRDGNLGDLPFLANVLALFSQAFDDPDPPTFERAHAVFRLADEVVTFDRLDLAGPLFEMPGHGTLDLGGYVDLTFRPDFIKSMALPGAMQLPGLGDVLDFVLREEVLYEVRVRGDIARASPEVVILPLLEGLREPTFEGTGVAPEVPRRIPRWFR